MTKTAEPEQADKLSLSERTLNLVASFFAKSPPPAPRVAPKRAQTRTVENAVGSMRHVIVPSEKNAAFYQELGPRLSGGEIAAANLQVLGLNALKAKVGAQWQKHSSVIQTVIEGALSKALTPEDRYWRLDDEIYVIAFHDNDLATTIRRTEEIGAAIVRKLVGTDTGDLVSVKALRGTLSHTQDGMIAFTEKPKKQTVTAVAQAMGKTGEVTFEPWAKTLRNKEHTEELNNLLDQATKYHAEKSATRATNAPEIDDLEEALRAAAAAKLNRGLFDYSLGFAPIWDAHKKAITTYAVLPYYHDEDRWYFEHNVIDETPSLEDILDLDIACLRIAIRETAKSFTSGSAVLTISQIHYLTLTSPKGLEEVLRECERVPAFLSKYLSIQVVGMPAELPSRAFIRTIAKLHRFVRLIAARATTHMSLAHLKTAGFNIVTLKQLNPELTPSDVLAYQRIVAESHKLSLPVVMEYITSIDTAIQLAELGMAHLSGPSISAPLPSPRGLLWLDLASMPIEANEAPAAVAS